MNHGLESWMELRLDDRRRGWESLGFQGIGNEKQSNPKSHRGPTHVPHREPHVHCVQRSEPHQLRQDGAGGGGRPICIRKTTLRVLCSEGWKIFSPRTPSRSYIVAVTLHNGYTQERWRIQSDGRPIQAWAEIQRRLQNRFGKEKDWVYDEFSMRGKEMEKRCPNRPGDEVHHHVRFESGRTRAAQEYPPPLCKARCSGIKEQIEVDRKGEFLTASVDKLGEVDSKQLLSFKKELQNRYKTVDEEEDQTMLEAYGDVFGAQFDPKKVLQARHEEVDYVKKMHVSALHSTNHCHIFELAGIFLPINSSNSNFTMNILP